MKCINNPSLLAGFPPVSVTPIMALATKRGKETVVTKKLAISPRLVVNILALIFSALLTYGMEDKIRLLGLCILLVFALALGGCIPQPSTAFQWLVPTQ
jgi:hypothetical protein